MIRNTIKNNPRVVVAFGWFATALAIIIPLLIPSSGFGRGSFVLNITSCVFLNIRYLLPIRFSVESSTSKFKVPYDLSHRVGIKLQISKLILLLILWYQPYIALLPQRYRWWSNFSWTTTLRLKNIILDCLIEVTSVMFIFRKYFRCISSGRDFWYYWWWLQFQ